MHGLIKWAPSSTLRLLASGKLQEGAMKVFIIESSNPEDFYRRELDGSAAQGILNILGIRNELRLAMDREYFQKAIADAN
jgi:hypothetical protein